VTGYSIVGHKLFTFLLTKRDRFIGVSAHSQVHNAHMTSRICFYAFVDNVSTVV